MAPVAVSRVERRGDLQISTLCSDAETMGGKLRPVVGFPDGFPDRQPLTFSEFDSLRQAPEAEARGRLRTRTRRRAPEASVGRRGPRAFFRSAIILVWTAFARLRARPTAHKLP